VPVSVTAQSAAELRARGVVSALDLQKVSPGVTAIQSSRAQDAVTFIIRGQSLADIILSTDPSIGIYVDGNYQSRVYGLKAGMYDLDHVEVLKGPQGTLYGKNTTGGAVNIFTHDATLDRGGYLRLYGGSWATLGIEGAANLPINDKLAVRLSAIHQASDGWGANQVTRKNDDNFTGIRGKIRYEPTDQLSINLSGSYTRFESGGATFKAKYYPSNDPGAPGNNSLAVTYAAGALGFTPATAAAAGFPNQFAQALNYLQTVGGTGDTRKYENNGTRLTPNIYDGWDTGLIVRWDGGTALQLKSQTYYKRFQRRSVTDLDNTPLPFFHTDTYTHAWFLSQEFQATGKLLDNRLNYVTGLYYSYEKGFEGSRSAIADPANPPLNDAIVMNASGGAYLQATYAFTDAFSVTGGLRWSIDDRRAVNRAYIANTRQGFGFLRCNVLVPTAANPAPIPQSECRLPGHVNKDAINYNITGQYKFSPDLNVYATARSGYRAGGFNITSSGNAGLLPFRPEKVTDQEIGMKSQWFDDRVRFNIAAFHSDYKDIQKSTVVTFQSSVTGAITSSTLVNNAAAAKIKGVEIELNAQPTRNLGIHGFFNYVDAHYTKFIVSNLGTIQDFTNAPFEVPKYSASLGANYTWDLPVGSLVARLDWNWRDDVIFGNNSLLRPTETRLAQPAYSLLDGRLEWNIPERQMKIALVGRNLTNKYYYTTGTQVRNTGMDFVQIGEPRYIGAEVSWTLGGG